MLILGVLLTAASIAIWLANPGTRLALALTSTTAALAVGHFVDIPISSYGRQYAIVGFVMISATAINFSRTRSMRRAPATFSMYGYSLLAVVSLVLVARAADAAFAAAIAATWIALTLAALFTARTVMTRRDLLRVLWGVFLGVLIGQSFILFDWITHGFPGDAWRWRPFGANPNQMAELASIGALLAFVLRRYVRAPIGRLLLITITWFSLLLAAFSASRSAVIFLSIAFIPLIVYRRGRVSPLRSIGLVTAIIGLLILTSTVVLSNSRLHVIAGSELSRRVVLATGFTELPQEQVLFGLLLTDGEIAAPNEIASGASPHNAYAWIAYVGGLVLLGAYGILLLAVFRATLGGLRNRWVNREFSPLLIRFLAAYLVASYIHGAFSIRPFYPTTIEAFLHVFVAIFFLAVHKGTGRASLDPIGNQHKRSFY